MGRFLLSPRKDFTVKAEVMGMLLFLCRRALCPFPQSLECLFLMNITGSFFSDILEQRRTKQGFPGGSAAKNLPAMQEPQETRVLFLGWEDPLEKSMATHSSILACRIPWTEQPGGLQSWGRNESDTTEVTEHTCVQVQDLGRGGSHWFLSPPPWAPCQVVLECSERGAGMFCCPLPLLLRVPSSAAPESVVYGRTQLNHIFLCSSTCFLILTISF